MGRLRIIAGALKGRRIQVAADVSVRPTPDRVREALFSILHDSVVGASVLDAYAGSGALGFEALSRGARHAVFVDVSPVAVKALERTRAELGCQDRAQVISGEALVLVERGSLAGPFDLVFVDPPYRSQERNAFLDAASATNLVAPGGCLVVETDATKGPEKSPILPGLVHRRQAVYGRVALDFYDRGGLG